MGSAMDGEKDAFYIVRKGDIIGVYRSLSECQEQAGSSVSHPAMTVYKGYGWPNGAEDLLSSFGIKNALFSINASYVKDDAFGKLIPCPAQQPSSCQGGTSSKPSPAKRLQEMFQESDESGSFSPSPPQKLLKIENVMVPQVTSSSFLTQPITMSNLREEVLGFTGIPCCHCGNSQILPPGFKFHPTDEELINHYLLPKVLNSGFTSLAIQETDINTFEPWELLGRANLGEKERYFFILRNSKFPMGQRTNRATPDGYWKAYGSEKLISSSGKPVGKKKTHVFYKGRAPTGERSDWGMDEYCLYDISNSSNKDNYWMIARVYQKTGLPITERRGGARVSISSDQEQ